MITALAILALCASRYLWVRSQYWTEVRLTKGWYTYRTYFDSTCNGEPYILFANNQRKYLYQEDCVFKPLNWNKQRLDKG